MEIPAAKFPPKFKVVNGFNFAPQFPDQNIISGLNYKAKDDDLFIATFPKCGTTWTQQILVLLVDDGDIPEDLHLYVRSPFLESLGANAVEAMPRPGAIKCHLPYQMVPYNPNAKYIYVMRNPKDACVSFYYHTKTFKEYQFKGDFHDYLLSWLRGEIECGKYNEHVLSWWPHRHDTNVLILLYEDMKNDVRDSILKLAGFIGEEYKSKLLQKPEILDKIVKHSDINYMKQTTNKVYEKRSRENKAVAEDTKYEFIRKGIVGDWKNHFTAEENTLFENWFRETFKGTGVESLWDKYNVFEYRCN